MKRVTICSNVSLALSKRPGHISEFKKQDILQGRWGSGYVTSGASILLFLSMPISHLRFPAYHSQLLCVHKKTEFEKSDGLSLRSISFYKQC